jgi:hypothetical protein
LSRSHSSANNKSPQYHHNYQQCLLLQIIQENNTETLNTNPPQFLLDKDNRQLIIPIDKAYPYIYCILQDQHWKEQRAFYWKYADSLTGLRKWRSTDLTRWEQVYLLLLGEIIQPDVVNDWAREWLRAFKRFTNRYCTKCNICGVVAMGGMCGGGGKDIPIYISFYD